MYKDCSMEEFVDALMLFGASLEARPKGFRLVVSSSLEKKSLVAWAVAMLEVHNIKTQHCSSAPRIVYKTGVVPFLKPAHDRWYAADGHKKAPRSIHIIDRVFAAWLIPHLAAIREDVGICLDAPRLDSVTSEIYALQIRDIGFVAEAQCVDGEKYVVHLPLSQRQELENWLCAYVPRAVWQSSDVMRGVS